jgi:hypothetical protein
MATISTQSHAYNSAASMDDMAAQALEIEITSPQFASDAFGVVKSNASMRNRTLKHLALAAQTILSRDFEINSNRDLEADILDFYEGLKKHPVPEHHKGSTTNGLNLWLHLLVRALQPDLVIESGVYMGRSLYSLRVAAPKAEIHAFDISFAHLGFRDPGIYYHEMDWTRVDLPRAAKAFAYFDDHINNGKRIVECAERGIHHLVFDQCAYAAQVQAFRYPGLPSALMLQEDEMGEGDMLEWTWNGHHLGYQHHSRNACGARTLMQMAKPLPSLARYTGEEPGLAAYVRLRAGT